MAGASIEVVNHQERHDVDLARLEAFAVEAVRRVEALPAPQAGAGAGAFDGLDAIEVSIVSDEVIAEVHGQFMNDPVATDVITFDHGEIVVSADTAARYAAEQEDDPEISALGEMALYLLHGLLHLRGYDDREPADREVMHAMQSSIFEELWKQGEA